METVAFARRRTHWLLIFSNAVVLFACLAAFVNVAEASGFGEAIVLLLPAIACAAAIWGMSRKNPFRFALNIAVYLVLAPLVFAEICAAVLLSAAVVEHHITAEALETMGALLLGLAFGGYLIWALYRASLEIDGAGKGARFPSGLVLNFVTATLMWGIWVLWLMSMTMRGIPDGSPEGSAVGTLRTINTSEITYMSINPQVGFTCELAALERAELIDPILASGNRSGYRFYLLNCKGAPADHYQAVGLPTLVGKHQLRAFCVDETGVVKSDIHGDGWNCLAKGEPLK